MKRGYEIMYGLYSRRSLGGKPLVSPAVWGASARAVARDIWIGERLPGLVKEKTGAEAPLHKIWEYMEVSDDDTSYTRETPIIQECMGRMQYLLDQNGLVQTSTAPLHVDVDRLDRALKDPKESVSVLFDFIAYAGPLGFLPWWVPKPVSVDDNPASFVDVLVGLEPTPLQEGPKELSYGWPIFPRATEAHYLYSDVILLLDATVPLPMLRVYTTKPWRAKGGGMEEHLAPGIFSKAYLCGSVSIGEEREVFMDRVAALIDPEDG